MDLQPSVDQRLVFILREPQEPVISGVEKAIPELLRAWYLPALMPVRSISPSPRTGGGLHLEWEASSSGHSVGPGLPCSILCLSCQTAASIES